MTEFIRLPSRVLNIGLIQEIRFDHCEIQIYWQGGEISTLNDLESSILLNRLERDYGLMSDESAELWLTELEAALPQLISEQR